MLIWRQNFKNTKVELYSVVILWKMIQDFTQYSLNKGHQHHKWQQQKSWISHPDCQVAIDKELMQYLLIPRKKWKTLKIIENSKIGVSRHLDSSPRHKWPKSWSSMEDPVVLRERNLYGHSFGRTVMGKAFWENPIDALLGKNSKLGMSLRSSWKRIILICACGWHKIGWKQTKLIRCGKYSTKKSIWED